MEPDSFPTYAELTQTQAWAGGAPVPVAACAPAPAHEEGTRYTESAMLGSGGMGKVMLARDARIGREVAVKVLHKRVLADDDRARFLREAQVQGQLEHPSIVPVYDIDRGPDGATFFTMRRVLGKTLAAILDELRAGTGRTTQRELLQAFATVCLTIDYAHSRGVIHRDLKPSNIMLGDFGEVYVLDWGVARVLGSSESSPKLEPASRLSRPGATMGTPLYIAPEQVADPDVGPAADVFSLGAILFEILTLQRLRSLPTLYDALEARPSVRAPNSRIAPELESVCVKATQADPSARYPSARALQEAIARYLEGDREVEQRRALANQHADRARMALAADQPQHELAMLELARALALDPTNIEHVAMMSEVLRAPPTTTPPEIEERIAAGAQVVSRAGARYGIIAMLTWLAFFPLLLVLGIRRYDYVVGIVLPVFVTIVMGVIALRASTIRRPIQYALLASMQIAGMMLSRIFGPLIMMPTIMATSAIVLQAHPERRLRVVGLVGSILAIALPVLVEAIGIAPASYDFTTGFAVVPQTVDFPATATIGFLLTASLASTAVPALFVAWLRVQLTDSQRRELMQTYRVRQLGEAMLHAVH